MNSLLPTRGCPFLRFSQQASHDVLVVEQVALLRLVTLEDAELRRLRPLEPLEVRCSDQVPQKRPLRVARADVVERHRPLQFFLRVLTGGRRCEEVVGCAVIAPGSYIHSVLSSRLMQTRVMGVRVHTLHMATLLSYGV